MSAAIVLLIESRQTLAASLEPALVRAGYRVERFTTGRAALARPRLPVPTVIIFDARARRTNGVRVWRQLRARWGESAFVHCRAAGVALDATIAAAAALEMPFTARKVLNRVRLLLPPPASESPTLTAGPYALYGDQRLLHIDGRGEFALTPKMADLLALFLRQPNTLVSRVQLMQQVWHTDYVGDTRTLDVHVRWLREIVEDDPGKPVWLQTVRGKGYVFNLPPAPDDAPNKNAT